MVDDGREVTCAKREIGIVEVKDLTGVERAVKRRHAMIVIEGQRDEAPRVEVVAGIVNVALVNVANRLRESRRARRVQDVAARARLEFEIQVEIDLGGEAAAVVAQHQRGSQWAYL